jgi:GTP-binding protein HflX
MGSKAYNAKANTELVYAIRALLITVQKPNQLLPQAMAIEEEMKRLAKTAGLQTVETVFQNIRTPNSITLIGKGKVKEIADMIEAAPDIDAHDRDNGSIDIILFGSDLSPVQQRNLEKLTGRRVIDRSELILDIFAQHAITRDGKIQVELAQLQYLKPRLVGRGKELSKLGGGIGTRGPGETKLEVDRRRIDSRIRRLKEEYKKCRAVGKVQRQARQREGVISVALVGYTNAGKSTILNRLTKSKVIAENKLFCTLDTTTRKLFLTDGTRLLLSDTVGFIEELPPLLLGAFRATLAEVIEADALIHVLDASSDDADRHIETVMEVLGELNAADKPMLTLLNKRDLIEEEAQLRYLERVCTPSVTFSALKDKDMLPLFEAMRKLVEEAQAYRNAPKPNEEDEVEYWM